MSLQSLGVAGQLVPLGEGHDPLVYDPLVPGDHWTAPVHRRIVLTSAIMLFNVVVKFVSKYPGAISEESIPEASSALGRPESDLNGLRF